MKILVAPDKFKGSLSAQEVCQAIAIGLKKQGKKLEVISHPMADGGDGSLAILSDYLNLKKQEVQTLDPLGRTISAPYYTSETAAFIEVASASGLVLLEKKERNPLITSTLGTGKMINHARSQGYQQIYLFLGGSATNDAGMGIASALGFQFFDAQDHLLNPIGECLAKVKSIKNTVPFDPKKIEITLLCDVTNPLFGPHGAAYVYAAQKGANAEQIKYLDQGLQNFSQLIQQSFGRDVAKIPGGGAAGGIGAGLIGLLGANIEKGFDVMAQLTRLETQIQGADWVITGEGKLDAQSLQGKVIDGIAGLCRKHQKPLTLLVGASDLRRKDLEQLNIKQLCTISEQATNLEDAMLNGAQYLEQLAERLVLL